MKIYGHKGIPYINYIMITIESDIETLLNNRPIVFHVTRGISQYCNFTNVMDYFLNINYQLLSYEYIHGSFIPYNNELEIKKGIHILGYLQENDIKLCKIKKIQTNTDCFGLYKKTSNMNKVLIFNSLNEVRCVVQNINTNPS